MLYMLGGISFEVMPLNIYEVTHETGADYAAKDVVGAFRPREYMGPADPKLNFKGRLFPHKFGGLPPLTALQAMAVAGIPQMLIRGDGFVFGWYLIEKIEVGHGFIDAAGLGRMIEFDIDLVYSPRTAGAGAMLGMITTLFG